MKNRTFNTKALLIATGMSIFSVVLVFFGSKKTIENIAFQKFIYPRGKYRWVAHFMIAVGCTSAFLITIPLTFGWIHFTMAPNSISLYEAHFFGFKVMEFKLDSIMALLT